MVLVHHTVNYKFRVNIKTELFTVQMLRDTNIEDQSNFPRVEKSFVSYYTGIRCY